MLKMNFRSPSFLQFKRYLYQNAHRIGFFYIIVCGFYWSFPIATNESNFSWIGTSSTWLGLWQNWSMFAPNPPQADINITCDLETADHETHSWSIFQTTDEGILARYQLEKWRKFANDNLPNATPNLKLSFAKWVAAEAQLQSKAKIVSVTLYAHTRPIVLPTDAVTPRWKTEKLIHVVLP
jgi:hypothetical protein